MTDRQPTRIMRRAPARKRVTAEDYVRVGKGGGTGSNFHTAHSSWAIEITTPSTVLLDQQWQLDNSMDAGYFSG